MRYLEPEEILAIHSEIIDATGGSHGVREIGLLLSIVVKPQASFGGKELYEGVFIKAAVYLESLARFHVFVDGNKRTAIAAAVRFLYINGVAFAVTNREVEQFVRNVVVKCLGIETIADWLKSHTR